jgi:hypothetical protein
MEAVCLLIGMYEALLEGQGKMDSHILIGFCLLCHLLEEEEQSLERKKIDSGSTPKA